MRSTDITTRKQTLAVLLRYPSPRIMLAALLPLLVIRLFVGQWGRGDVIVAIVTLFTVGIFEWVVHLYLLHAPEDSFRMTKLGTGTGHRRHHLDPADLHWILLKRNDVVGFIPMFGLFTASWTLPVLWITGSGLLSGFLTGYTLAIIGLLHYEWVHLLVHTRYKPKSRYYKRLERNHRLHHYRNENYWLGVTSNMGDRILGTLPKDKSDVPLSETARTLS